MDQPQLRNFLEIPYDELQSLNLEAKKRFLNREPEAKVKKHYLDYLERENRLKAVTVCFSDIEGRFHMLDYDKEYFIKNLDGLTFDGSSIRGFSEIDHSDLRLKPDLYSFRWLPSDVFGPGKVIIFANVCDQDGQPYVSDFRYKLLLILEELSKKKKQQFFLAPELEGFLLEGQNAEQAFDEKVGFRVASEGGYYHTLPTDTLKQFIDRAAEAQRALGFENEKDHPEVAPSQFELNFSYTDALLACDQIQLYKLVCRQVAHNMGMTASFLPKPFVGINGSGMHINISLFEAGKNLFYDVKDSSKLSKTAWGFINKILNHANDICLVLNASVNSYRRLDPHFEAPNQIKYSYTDRSAMIRIPLATKNSTRIEVRSVSPDSNPYAVALTLLKTGLDGTELTLDEDKRQRTRTLPDTITDAIKLFKSSDFVEEMLGEVAKSKYIEQKQSVANRNPKELGKTIKNQEVLYHHEITNQVLWNRF
jgi:glutamine synthetase